MSWQQSIITLMRHGEPVTGNKSAESVSIFRGITDDVLNNNGWQQMYDSATQLPRLDGILTSPLRRCSEFAQKFSSENDLPLLQDDALKEIDFGDWEGRSVDEVKSESDELLKSFWQNPLNNTPPNGEPVRDFQARVILFWNEFLANNRGKNNLIITHGGVQKMILAQVLNMPMAAVHNIEVPYACCSVIHAYYSESDIITTLKSHGC